MPPETARAAAEQVAARVLELPGFSEPHRLALYAGLPDELPTELLFATLRRAGKTCLLPRCRADGTLEFAPVTVFEELVPGRYGVREPEAAAVPLAPEDWVIVPGVAFDETGRRLGRGGGYYDRTFAATGPVPRRIGVAYAFQCETLVPAEAHDGPVDALVTEAETRIFTRWDRWNEREAE